MLSKGVRENGCRRGTDAEKALRSVEWKMLVNGHTVERWKISREI